MRTNLGRPRRRTRESAAGLSISAKGRPRGARHSPPGRRQLGYVALVCWVLSAGAFLSVPEQLSAEPIAARGDPTAKAGESRSPHARKKAAHRRRSLAETIAELVAQPTVQRAHWGVAVAGMDGVSLFAMNEGQFFQPASNTKLFTTAAAMAKLGGESTAETEVVARGTFTDGSATLQGDVLLVGGGDATLSGEELPYAPPPERTTPLPPRAAPPAGPDPLRYLAAMADAVAATGLKRVTGDVIGDDTAWPYEPYPEDWANDDLVWGYGAPVSALTLADNQLRLVVTPSEVVGAAATVTLEQAVPYYTLEQNVTTAAARSAGSGVQVERLPGSRTLRVYGVINTDASAEVEEIAIADPAEYAAMALRAMLEARGVTVTGVARASHTPSTEHRGFGEIARSPLTPKTTASSNQAAACADCPAGTRNEERVLARRASPPLAQDVVLTNKVSQNLHAELMQRRLGAALADGGTAAQGARVVRSFLLEAGVDPEDFIFYDGSGLSGHDLVTPRAAVRLLLYASGQPWFEAWRASLPVAGVDGSLRTRFGEKSGLKGRVFAKTGTLGEARALSGYLVGASGRTVVFSVMATDHAPDGKDREVMDGIVEAIAEAE